MLYQINIHFRTILFFCLSSYAREKIESDFFYCILFISFYIFYISQWNADRNTTELIKSRTLWQEIFNIWERLGSNWYRSQGAFVPWFLPQKYILILSTVLLFMYGTKKIFFGKQWRKNIAFDAIFLYFLRMNFSFYFNKINLNHIISLIF